jgi:glutamine amidotransferase
MALARIGCLAASLGFGMTIDGVTVVDYGVGNLRSLVKMFERIRVSVRLSSQADAIASASRIVLPGVGAFDNAMQKLRVSGLEEPLRHAVISRQVPVLGVCLGMQLLGLSSEEGALPGLGWIDAQTRRLPIVTEGPGSLRLPHMGWASVRARRSNRLLAEAGPPRFYFVHSFAMSCNDESAVLGTARYGAEFTAAVNVGNIWGVQFHPEKSHRFGMDLLSNFAGL